jgi:aryl-alcohol dehydrogenase-like predicted oxidoreductase
MEYRKLGSSGLEVSAVGLGTNNFGRRLDFPGTEKVIKAVIDQGVNFIDTADVYSAGASEEFIGRAVKGQRDKVVIGTKGSGQMGSGPNTRGNSRKHITEAVNASLKRLDTDYIDLYQVHFLDPKTPIEETLRALDDAVHQGKVLYIGCSNFTAWQACEAVWTSRCYGLNSFVSVQPEYNILNRSVEAELVPFCKEYNLGIIPYSPLASGFLTGKYRPGEEPPSGTRLSSMPQGTYRDRFLNERNYAILPVLESFAEERGHTVGELAIAWLLAQPQVATVIAGAMNPEQVAANTKAAEWRLAPEEVKELDGRLAAFR